MIAEVSEAKKKVAIKSEMMTTMATILKEKHLDYVTFRIRFTDYIAPDPQTGKKKLIVRE